MNKIVFLFLINFYLFAQVTNDFFSNGKSGWFYYKEEKPLKKKDRVVKHKKISKKQTNEINETEETISLMDKPIFKSEEEVQERIKKEDEYINNIKWDKLDDLSTDEYKRLLETTKRIAVGRPTKKNVSTYMRLQQFWINKSEKFAKVWQVALAENPSLGAGLDTTNSGIAVREAKLKKETKDFFEKKRDRLGFIVLIETIDDKEIVDKLKRIYNIIKKDYKIDYKILSLYDVPFLANRLKISQKNLPQHIFLYRGKKNKPIYKKIYNGIGAVSSIIKNTIFIFDNAVLEKYKWDEDKKKIY